MTMLDKLRSGLYLAALLIFCFLGLQSSFLLSQAGIALAEVQSSASRVLLNASETVDAARSTLTVQQGYYRDSASHVKALTRAAAIDAVQFGRLIEAVRRSVDNTDARLDRISLAADASLGSLRNAADALAARWHDW